MFRPINTLLLVYLPRIFCLEDHEDASFPPTQILDQMY